MTLNKCRICQKTLTDPVSIQAGVGTVCRLSAKETEAALSNNFFPPSNFSFSATKDVLVIIDLNRGGRSVTNDIETVLATVKQRGVGESWHLAIYRDAFGIWDGITLDDHRKFAGFYPLNTTRKSAAITRCLAKYAYRLKQQRKKPCTNKKAFTFLLPKLLTKWLNRFTSGPRISAKE